MGTTKTTAKPTSPPAGDGTAERNAYAELMALTRSGHSRHSYYSDVLRIVANALASPCAAVSVRHASEVIEHEFLSDQENALFWMPGVQHFLTESLAKSGSRARLLDSKDGESKVALLGATLFDSSQEPIGALALIVGRDGSLDAARKLMYLEALACFASYSGRTEPAQRNRPSASGDATQAMAYASKCDTPEEFAFSVTNNLRNKLGCEQAALGMAVRGRIKILSISGLDHVAEQSTGVRALQAAMEECLDGDRIMVSADENAWSDDNAGSRFRLHQQWRVAVNGDAVASIPLHARGKTVAVLSLRREADRPFTQDQIEQIRTQVEPFASALLLLGDANRGLLRHGADDVTAATTNLMSAGRTGRKILILLLITATAWIAFGTVDYDLTVPCVIKPKESRHITAPFDAVLAGTNVFQGDLVKQGDVLCRFDKSDLEQSWTELNAELNIYEREKDQSMAEDDPVGFQLASANQKLSLARLNIIETRIKRCTVRSPIDGVLVTGDLRKRIGSVVEMGDPLFEIAPPHGLIVELAVPESDAEDLAVGLTGTFAPSARPEQTRSLRVLRILPRTEIRERGNACIVEAATNLEEGWLRPGMEGVARIHVGRRPVWWVGIHRIVDYLRLKLWL